MSGVELVRCWLGTFLRDGWGWEDDNGEGTGWEPRATATQWHVRAGTLESLLQLAARGLLAPVLARLLSLHLPALKWCGKMLLEVGRWKIAVSRACSDSAAMTSVCGVAKRLKASNCPGTLCSTGGGGAL